MKVEDDVGAEAAGVDGFGEFPAEFCDALEREEGDGADVGEGAGAVKELECAGSELKSGMRAGSSMANSSPAGVRT